MKLTSFVMCALFTSKEKIIRLTPALFGQQAGSVSEVLPEIASKRFVIFGEEHGKLPIINFQSQIIKQMLAQAGITQALEGAARNCLKYMCQIYFTLRILCICTYLMLSIHL